jgi:membrane protease YdiL (CAAX protease family)
MKEILLNILIILMIILFSQPLVAYCIQLNLDFLNSISDYIPKVVKSMKQMEEDAKLLTEGFLRMNNIGDLLFNLFLIAIIPAIGEEMFFRGVIQKKLKNILRNPHIAILITSFIFSAIHMQFFGFLPRFFLGIILGYLFYYSGSLWMPIIAHFINNALFVFLSYLYPERINEDISISMIQAVISLLIVLFFIYLYKQINNKAID